MVLSLTKKNSLEMDSDVKAKVRVLVIDDSALMRRLLTEVINVQPDLEVVGAAADAFIARDMIKQLNPDVITLDVEMPKMDGLDFLERLMRLRPTPVIMISTLTEKGSETTLRALELGAIDFVSKPKFDQASTIGAYVEEISEKIRVASTVKMQAPKMGVNLNQAGLIKSKLNNTENFIFIGASTGGTEAISKVLMQMPTDCPGILITQHMPEKFTRSFAQRLDGLCAIKVTEAEHNQRIQPGHAYIAPGHSHLLIKRTGNAFFTHLSEEDPVNRHRPAVDVLFDSAARCLGDKAIGVILTGMGKDGAIGLLNMKKAGAYTLAQDKDSCVVFGMPREAIAMGGVDKVVPITEIARSVLNKA